MDTTPSHKRAAGTAVRGPKIFSTHTPISTFNPNVAVNHPLPTSIQKELGYLSNHLAARAKNVRFSNTCTEKRGPPKLYILQIGAHPETLLLHNAAEQRVSISLHQGIDNEGGRQPSSMANTPCIHYVSWFMKIVPQ